jgi:hypothetical protein
MEQKTALTHAERVALYRRIIQEKLGGALTDFNVAYMRAHAPTELAMRALNEALQQLGWQK